MMKILRGEKKVLHFRACIEIKNRRLKQEITIFIINQNCKQVFTKFDNIFESKIICKVEVLKNAIL